MSFKLASSRHQYESSEQLRTLQRSGGEILRQTPTYCGRLTSEFFCYL